MGNKLVLFLLGVGFLLVIGMEKCQAAPAVSNYAPKVAIEDNSSGGGVYSLQNANVIGSLAVYGGTRGGDGGAGGGANGGGGGAGARGGGGGGGITINH